MEQSELERGRFHQRVNKLLDLMLVKPASFNQLPVPPIYKPTNSLDQVIDRAKFTFQSSIWRRSKHILVSIKTYGGAGFISQVITMSTLLIETWGLTHYLVRAITDYRKTEDLERLNDVCAEIFNCMQAFIALPSSNYELDRSIDLRAELKNLETKFPTVLEIYDSLNDATLLNNIEYYKWWVVWQYSSKPKTKDSYIKYYKYTEKVFNILEQTITGLVSSIEQGLGECEAVMDTIKQSSTIINSSAMWSHSLDEGWLTIEVNNQFSQLILERQAVDNSSYLVVTVYFTGSQNSMTHTARCFVLKNRTANLSKLMNLKEAKLDKIELVIDDTVSIEIECKHSVELNVNFQSERLSARFPRKFTYRLESKNEDYHPVIDKCMELFSW